MWIQLGSADYRWDPVGFVWSENVVRQTYIDRVVPPVGGVRANQANKEFL